MQQAKLEVQLREASGKGAARATRRAGLVPAIVYGHKVAPAPVQLPERSLRNFMSSGGENVIIHMHLGEDEVRSEEHTSELQSHSFISYAVFCLKKKNNKQQ